MKIYPSLIAADVLNLEKVIVELEPHCAGFHLDVMDFHFVNNLTFGPLFINAMRKVAQKQLWIHLMVDQPHNYFNLLQLNRGDIVSVHVENVHDPEILADMQVRGWHVSLAINPETSVEKIVPFLLQVDQILLMSVHPGFSGQQFILETFNKLDQLNKLRQEQNLNFSIGIDGGVNKDNAIRLYRASAQDFVIGEGIFSHKDHVKILKELMRGQA